MNTTNNLADTMSEIEKAIDNAYEQGRRHGEEKYKPLMAAVIDFLSSDHESEEEDIKYNFLKQVFDNLNKLNNG